MVKLSSVSTAKVLNNTHMRPVTRHMGEQDDKKSVYICTLENKKE